MTDEQKAQARTIAEETFVGDLIDTVLDELRQAPDVWQKLSQNAQQTVIDRLEKRVKYAAVMAVQILASQNRPAIMAQLDQITIKDGVKAVLKLSKSDPLLHDLADAQGSDVMVVIPNMGQIVEAPAGVEGEKDQRELPLSEEDSALFDQAVELVEREGKVSISIIQRGLRIDYNHAASIVRAMAAAGIVPTEAKDGSLINLDSAGKGSAPGETEKALSEALQETPTEGESAANPFIDEDGNKITSARKRIAIVSTLSREQLDLVSSLPDLQNTVIARIQMRYRKLEASEADGKALDEGTAAADANDEGALTNETPEQLLPVARTYMTELADPEDLPNPGRISIQPGALYKTLAGSLAVTEDGAKDLVQRLVGEYFLSEPDHNGYYWLASAGEGL